MDYLSNPSAKVDKKKYLATGKQLYSGQWLSVLTFHRMLVVEMLEFRMMISMRSLSLQYILLSSYGLLGRIPN
jgi:hypothetical protein